MTEPYILCGDIQIQLKKRIQYRKDLKDHKTLHPLCWNSKPYWKRQFIIEMITKMTEHYIVCRDIQHPTEKDSSVLKWLQRWQNITFFVGTFNFRFQRSQSFTSFVGTLKFQQKKSSLVLKLFQRWQNHVFFVETIKLQLKNQFSIEMISRIKELYILCRDIQISTEKHRLLFKWLQRWQTLTFFVGAFKFQLKEAYIFLLGHSNSNWKKTVHYPNDFKYDRTLHRLADTQIPTEKKQFSIEMILKVRDPNILCRDIQNPTEKDNSV